MLKTPEAIFYFQDTMKVQEFPGQLSLWELLSLLPVKEFLIKALWVAITGVVIVRLIWAAEFSVALQFLGMIIGASYFAIALIWSEFRPPRKNNMRGRVFLYKNKIKIHGVWGLNIYDALFSGFLMPSFLAYILLFNAPSASNVILAIVIVSSLLFAYRMWGGALLSI